VPTKLSFDLANVLQPGRRGPLSFFTSWRASLPEQKAKRQGAARARLAREFELNLEGSSRHADLTKLLQGDRARRANAGNRRGPGRSGFATFVR